MGRPKLYPRTIRVPMTQSQWDAVHSAATRDGVTVRQAIRSAIDAYTSHRPRKPRKRAVA